MRDVGVIYLCRFAEGEEPVRRFLQTYRAHGAGVEHDFHVVFKGFADRATLETFHALFDAVTINPIELDDSGLDLGAYVRAAKAVSNRRVIFLNTFSQFLGDNWLRHFDSAMNESGVGIAGASGSWQSNAASYERTLKRIFVNIGVMLGKQRTGIDIGLGGDDRFMPLGMQRRPLVRYLRGPFEYIHKVYEYGRHPNPHLRTNAFMVDRAQFLSLRLPPFKNKTQAYEFESGRHSLTRQYLARSLRPVVVGRDGKAYDIAQWDMSRTFWSGEQANLLISDNRTDDYATGTAKMRTYLEHIAWIDPWART
jgi:hypothetical protein